MKPILKGNLIISTVNWDAHDTIQSKIADFNFSKGLKTIMSGAWTYEKLAKNAADKLNISYQDAYKMGVDELLKLVS
jgi:hypothetical protein